MEFKFTRIVDTAGTATAFHADMNVKGVRVIRAGIERTPGNKSKYYVVLDKDDSAVAQRLIDHLVTNGHFDVTIL